mgnify:CR=1 FL=1
MPTLEEELHREPHLFQKEQEPDRVQEQAAESRQELHKIAQQGLEGPERAGVVRHEREHLPEGLDAPGGVVEALDLERAEAEGELGHVPRMGRVDRLQREAMARPVGFGG